MRWSSYWLYRWENLTGGRWEKCDDLIGWPGCWLLSLAVWSERRKNLIGWFQCRDGWTLSEDNPFANNSLAIVGRGIERGCLLLSLAVWSEAEESHWLISVSRRLDPVRGQPFCQQLSRHCGPWGWKGMLIALIGCLKRGGRISLVDWDAYCSHWLFEKGDCSHWLFEARRKNLIGWFQCQDDWTLSDDNPFANNSLAIVGRGIERGCLMLSLAVWSEAGRISLVGFSVETTGPYPRTTLLPTTVSLLWAAGLSGNDNYGTATKCSIT